MRVVAGRKAAGHPRSRRAAQYERGHHRRTPAAGDDRPRLGARRERHGLVARRKGDLGLRHDQHRAARAVCGRRRDRRGAAGHAPHRRHRACSTSRRAAKRCCRTAAGARRWCGRLPIRQRPRRPTDPQSTTADPRPHPFRPETDASWLDWSSLADLSPDGRTILFSETREGGGAKGAVYLRRASDPAPIHLGDGMGDALSPDGKWALGRHGAKLVLVPTGTGEHRELKHRRRIRQRRGLAPRLAARHRRRRRESAWRAIGSSSSTRSTRPRSRSLPKRSGATARAPSPFRPTAARGRHDRGTDHRPLRARRLGAPMPLAGAVKGEIPIQWSADGASLFVHDPTALPARVSRIPWPPACASPGKNSCPSDPAGVYKNRTGPHHPRPATPTLTTPCACCRSCTWRKG